MKIETTPAVLNTLRAYAEPFAHAPHGPAVLDLFPGGAAPVFPFTGDSDRGLGVLLMAAALHHPDDARGTGRWGGDTAALIAGLFARYGTDIFRLNRVPYDPLRACVESLAAARDADDRARVPGILRSVCDFFYATGPLTAWLAAPVDWETRAVELSRAVYWMGARSRTRTKARLFFWLACSLPGFAARADMSARARAFAGPVGDGHMRLLFDVIKPVRGAAAGPLEARLEAFADLARRAFPEAPWRLYLPLDAYLKPDGAGGYRCRAVQGGCRPCALAPHCPAAKHFLGAEGGR